MVAAALIIVGIVFRLIAMMTLGSRFTLVIRRQDDIQTKGIYRLMRHPSYFGSLLIIAGASMLNPVLGVIVMSWFFFISRIVVEENLLQSDKYLEYKNKVGMFFPKFRSKK